MIAQYVPAISVAAADPIKDKFVGVSDKISIAKNATKNNKVIIIETISGFFMVIVFNLWNSGASAEQCQGC